MKIKDVRTHVLEAPLSEMLRAHRERDLVPPSAMLPGGLGRQCGALLDRVVLTACARDPADRFASAAEMKLALLQLPCG